MIKKLVAFGITLASIMIPFTSLASTIRYEGGAENFVIIPGTEYSDTDLFDNFKNVVPGDELTQSITIENNSKKSDYIKVYLKAEPHGEDNLLSDAVVNAGEDVDSMNDFLSQLKLYVWNGDEVPYMNSPDETGNLTDYRVLGRLEYGKSMDLDLVLKVPIEMDNEYMNKVGEVDWVFMVEHLNYDKGGGGGGSSTKTTAETTSATDETTAETGENHGTDANIDTTKDASTSDEGPNNIPDDEKLRTNPDTSDNRAVGAYAALLVIGCICLVATILKKDKHKK